MSTLLSLRTGAVGVDAASMIHTARMMSPSTLVAIAGFLLKLATDERFLIECSSLSPAVSSLCVLADG